MGDADDLSVTCQFGQSLTQRVAEAAADPGFDLIEQEGGDSVCLGQNRFGGQRDAGELTSGSGFPERPWWFPRVGGEEDFDSVPPVLGRWRIGIVAGVGGFHFNGEPCLAQAESLEPGLDLLAKLPRGVSPRGGERSGSGLQRVEGLSDGTVQVFEIGFLLIQQFEPGLGLAAASGQFVRSAMKPGGQAAVEREPSFDFFESRCGVIVASLDKPAERLGHFRGLGGQPLEGARGLVEFGDLPTERPE